MKRAFAFAAALAATMMAPAAFACGAEGDVRRGPAPATLPTALVFDGSTLYTLRADGSGWKLFSAPLPGESGKRRKLMRSDDGRYAYLVRGDYDEAKHHHLLDMHTGGDVALALRGVEDGGSLSPDGRWLAAWSDSRRADERGLWLYDVARGQLARIDGADPGPDARVLWSQDSSGFYLFSFEDGTNYFRYTPADGQLRRAEGYASDGRIGFTRDGAPDKLHFSHLNTLRPFPTRLPDGERWAELHEGILKTGGNGIPTRELPLPGEISKRCGPDLLGWASRELVLVRNGDLEYAFDTGTGQFRPLFPADAERRFDAYW